MTHRCVSKLTIIGSDNGMSPGHYPKFQTNVGILLIRPLGTNFSEILIKIHTFSFNKMHLKMSSSKWWTFCLSLNVLTDHTWFKAIKGRPTGENPLQAWMTLLNGAGHLVATAGTTRLAPYHWNKSLQLIWRSGTTVDIYRYPIIKWYSVTWLNDRVQG